MSGWSEAITTVIASLREWRRWVIIRKVKKYENDPAVQDELEKRAIARANKRVAKRDDIVQNAYRE